MTHTDSLTNGLTYVSLCIDSAQHSCTKQLFKNPVCKILLFLPQEMMTHMDSVTEALSQTQLYERARDYHIFWELAMCGGDLIGSFSPYGSVLCRGE